MEQIQIIDSNKHVGETVKIGAWIANKRSSGKIAFLQLRDGTAFFQGVVFKPNFIEAFGEEAGTEKFQQIKHLSQETAVMVTGVIKEDSRSKFGYEMDITDLEVVALQKITPLRRKNTAQIS
ncbi:asparaginyl-tRNA synthetase [Enterococcus faecalis]|nr:asparaginyl-tRNA synthetase [Enterococcus faecalis]